MASTKVIFTYKRKRLSSCSGVGHVEVCPDYTSNFEVDKCQNATEGRSENREQNLKFSNCVNCGNVDDPVNCKSCLETCNIQSVESCFKRTCHAEKLSHTCSSSPLHKLSVSQENNGAQDSDATHKREMVLNSYELPGDRAVKTLCESIPMEVGNIRNSMTKDVNSFSPHVDRLVLGTSVTQSEQKDSDSLCQQNHLCDSKHVKAKMTAPLLTFSRRLKRKVDRKIFSELPVGEGSATINEGKSMGTYTYTCVASSQDKSVKESLDLNARNDLETRSVLWPSNNGMDSRETTESLCPCSGSCSDTLKNTSCEKDMNVDMSSVMTPTVTKTLGSNPSLSLNVEEVGNNLKENVRCLSNDRTVLPFCDDTDKTDGHHVSHQLQASNGESQLTSNSLDSKVATKIAEQKASSGAFVIDCNAIPEPDLQDQESDTVLRLSMVVKSHGHSMEEGHIKTQGLEWFGPHDVQSNTSLLQLPKDSSASVEGETKPKIKCLELFSEDVKKDTEVVCSKAKQNVTFSPGSEKDWLERSSNGSAFLGLSLPTTEALLGQSSKHGFMPPIQLDRNVRTREFIQNPPVHPSFVDHATSLAFRHRKLLESINTKTTALRRNRNISLVNFEPCLTMWTEEELDSLWIGIRRHGRGNWHAMLVDPRLHFAPWRAPRDLALQWEQEQVKLLSAQHMLQDRYVNPPGPYNVECSVGFLCSGTGLLREKISADTQLSFGEVYTQKACSYLRSSPHSVGVKQNRINPRKVESHSYGLLNNFQIGERPETGLATNNIVPHWLRGIHVASSRPVEPQMEAHHLVHPYLQPSGTAYESRNLKNNNVHSGLVAGGEVRPHVGFPNAGPWTRNQGMSMANNPIVIDSDDSSEETISDDHNIHS